MGKPRMIILIRHAQSEGNKNRDIHQFIPDHRVPLTEAGWAQAHEAGRQLRSMLKPDDTIQFITSPYRRTRETTEGIVQTLSYDDPTPSPFPRHTVKILEEPRLREQDFGNFQPCSAEMTRMWNERAEYGHFFYRIPNGESAADAYDRVSGFNESLWRQFGDEDFPSVCVLVTHGLMTRIFLMKWYHWSVEYFEDLRNVNHCEFVIMKLNSNNKYVLQNELRTWSELKRRAAAANPNGTSATTAESANTSLLASSPAIPTRRWGGCVNGCNHARMNWPRKVLRKNTAEYMGSPVQSTAGVPVGALLEEKEDNPIATPEADHCPALSEPQPKGTRKVNTLTAAVASDLSAAPSSPNDASANSSTSDEEDEATSALEEGGTPKPPPLPVANLKKSIHLTVQAEGFSDDSDYFPGMQHAHSQQQSSLGKTHSNNNISRSKSLRQRQKSKESKSIRKASEHWMAQSGMGQGARADALGDGDEVSDNPQADNTTASVPNTHDKDLPVLREALRGTNKPEEQSENGPIENEDMSRPADEGKLSEQDVDRMQEQDRKGLSEVY
ncbi:phosphoglycerate mutase-like protein [Sporormia fimetaria CBS 119925]|uniref:Phosphoglycerate mutase-like protein n=1 Tax=Sporormia fimetaria CBS 119925 TaxID=1340428 RepID=A0A6A6VCU9_9PLEO|nr:phosphoglycerate mutase-like protein [Sporormia fimetaria CBS 119925]